MPWDWDEYFINEAYMAAYKSKDLSTQVGAVVVGPDHEIRSKGYNGFCRSEDDGIEQFHQRPLKYALTEHAERNCIYNMARVGIAAKGCSMYCTWGPPCTDCARGIVQSGIVELVYHLEFPGSVHNDWITNIAISRDLLQRLGVNVRFWSGVPLVPEIRCGGSIHRFR